MTNRRSWYTMTKARTRWNVCNDACEGREVTVQSMWSLCMQRGRELSCPWHQERVSKHRLIMETDRNFPVRLYLIHSRLFLVFLPLLRISSFVFIDFPEKGFTINCGHPQWLPKTLTRGWQTAWRESESTWHCSEGWSLQAHWSWG